MNRLQGQNIQVGQSVLLTGQREPSVAERQMLAQLEGLKAQRLADAEAEALRIVEAAQAQAAGIEAAALEKAANIQAEQEAACRAGFEAGFAEGLNQAAQESAHLLASAQAIVEKAYEAEHRVMKGFQKRAVALVGDLARLVVGQELRLQPEGLLALVEDAVTRLHLTGKIKVVTSADTLEALQGFSAETGAALAGMSRFDWVADPQLEVGQVFVLSSEGNYDLSVETLLKHYGKALAAGLALEEEEKSVEGQGALQAESANIP